MQPLFPLYDDAAAAGKLPGHVTCATERVGDHAAHHPSGENTMKSNQVKALISAVSAALLFTGTVALAQSVPSAPRDSTTPNSPRASSTPDMNRSMDNMHRNNVNSARVTQPKVDPQVDSGPRTPPVTNSSTDGKTRNSDGRSMDNMRRDKDNTARATQPKPDPQVDGGSRTPPATGAGPDAKSRNADGRSTDAMRRDNANMPRTNQPKPDPQVEGARTTPPAPSTGAR